MILNDKAISKLAEHDIFMPYHGEKQRTLPDGRKAISYGLSQCGYDICLGSQEFLVFDRECYQEKGFALDPKCPQQQGYSAALVHSANGSFFELPAHSFGLGVSKELISMPDNVFAIVQGKSTYGRCGLITNILPIEPGWSGHLTMCLVNPTDFALRIYAEEGIAQVILFDCGQVEQAYTGHYQGQGASVQLAAV